MAVVYRHKRLDTNEVFYIGIGKLEKRAYSRHNRNKWWKNIINKTEYEVEILTIDLSWKDACELEILLIKEHGRQDLGLGNLVNLTDGGDGTIGFKPSIESKKLMSEKAIGRIWTEESKNKVSIGNKGRKRSEYAKKLMSEKRKNNPTNITKETREKIFNSRRESAFIIREITTGIEFKLFESELYFDIPKTTIYNNSLIEKPLRSKKYKGLNFIRINVN